MFESHYDERGSSEEWDDHSEFITPIAPRQEPRQVERPSRLLLDVLEEEATERRAQPGLAVYL